MMNDIFFVDVNPLWMIPLKQFFCEYGNASLRPLELLLRPCNRRDSAANFVGVFHHDAQALEVEIGAMNGQWIFQSR